MKKKVSLTVLVVTLIIVTIISILQYKKTTTNNSQLAETEDNLSGKVVLDNGIKSIDVTTNDPKVTNGQDYGKSGLDIIKKASELLGKPYSYDGKGGTAYNSPPSVLTADKVTGIDCSGLVWWTLSSLKMQTRGFSYNNPVPVNTRNWLADKNQYSFSELKTWKFENNQWTTEQANKWGPSVKNVNLQVKSDTSDWKNINVLKVNDPIASNLRYWEYYGSDGNKRELPMGTIIVSYGEGLGMQGHAWIYIGNLGNKSQAIATLRAMGVNINESYVIDKGNGCTHWRIESAGSGNVTINNGNPDYGAVSTQNNKRKGIGPIWAFQVANDVSISGDYHIAVSKKDADTSNTVLGDYSDVLAGAEFKIEQFKNNSSTSTDLSTTTTIADKKSATPVVFEKSKSNNVTIDDITKVDKYKIYESKAPEGYKNNSGIIELEVTKTIKNNGNSSVYQISNVRVRAGSWAKDLKPNSGNKVQITLGLESIDTDVATPGYVIGVEISANAITVTYKNNKEEKDVNVAINKRSTYNTEVDDVTLKYWAFDSEDKRPTASNMTGSINSQYAKENPFTIKKMKRGDIKYVWITEKSHNDLYTDGFFDITGEENQNIDCRYIFMKIVCDEASGSISVAYPNNEFKMLCQITKSGKLEYFEKTCEENTYIDNNGNTKYYVDVDKINVEDGNPANITVPIINPYKPIEYSIGLGKKLATGKLSDYKYPENLSDVEKELINDTSKFVSGAKFSVKQAFSQGNGNNTAWKDLGEVDENNNQVVVSKNGGYTDITGDEIPTGYSFIWYRIQEIAPVSGGKLNSNVYYVLMENYIQNSAEGNGVLVHLYKNPEINSETQIPIRDKNHEISTRIEGNGDIFIADKEDGFMVFFDTSTNSIQFVMVDENNTKKYNVNLAKINKDDIKDFSLEELNSDSIKQKMVENVKFNVKQEKKTTTEYLTEKNEKTVTTVQGDYTSVYKDVSIKSNNYETYTINEINAPSEYVIYDKKITMSVNNGLITSEDGSYYAPNLVIISVDIDGDGSINSNEEIILTTKKDSTYYSSHNILDGRIYGMIDDTDENNVNITLILADETYEGSYNINIVKKELKDNQEDNYQNENAKFISTLSDAKYSVQQSLNNDEYDEDGEPSINNLPDVTTTKDSVTSIVNDVAITNTDYPDTYLIKEKESPASYNINKLNLKLDIYKYKKDNKYTINRVVIKDEDVIKGEIYQGETLYISDKMTSNEYFEYYIVAVSLKENSVGDYTIEVTWRDDKPTYDINLAKTNATTGENIILSGVASADFNIKLYSDDTFTELAEFKDKDGVNLNEKEKYTTTDGEIKLKDIVMPDVKSGSITNYLAITETAITDPSYKMFEGTLIIPITFTRESNGKLTQSKGEAYIINNITEKQKIDDKINGDGEDDSEKITVLDIEDVITVVVPNQKSGEISLQLIKEGSNIKGETVVKYLDGAEFEVSIDNVDEEGTVIKNLYRSNPTDITGQNSEKGKIIINNLPIKVNDILKINIKEVSPPDGYIIPDKLKEGITYTATVANDLSINIDHPYDDSISSVRALFNKRILVYVNDEQEEHSGKYKINLTKKGEDERVLDEVTFKRTGMINNNTSTSNPTSNKKIDEKDFKTNSDGVICITDELGEEAKDYEGENGFVKVPIKDYNSSPDEYEISEINMGKHENSYVKLSKPISVSISKGHISNENRAYANRITLSIDKDDTNKDYVEINLLTNKYRKWTGAYGDFESVAEQDYNQGTEISIDVQDVNGLNYKILVSGTGSTDCSEITYSIVVVNPRQPTPSKYKVNIKKVGTDGTALNDITFARTANLNVDNQTGTAEKTVNTNMDKTANGGYASVTKDVETTGSELITVSKENYEKKDTYTIKEDDLGSYEGVYSKYPYDINLVIEKKYEDYTAGVDKAILTINNETREINISNITEQKITVTDDNGENLDVTMNASKENDEITITLIIENSELTSVPVEKRWVDGNDENNLRPDSINVELKYKKDGNFVKYEKDGVENPVTLNSNNNWKYTWEKLPKNINGKVAEYTVEETLVPSGYTVNTTTEGDVIVLTNNHTVTEVVAKSKQWENVANANLYRVDMELYKKGETIKIGDTKSVIGNDMASWRNCEKYDKNGNLIEYVVKETKAYYRTDENSENWIELEEGTDYVAIEEEDVFLNILNTPGKYKVMLSKIDKDSKQAIAGVTFNVNDIVTNPTENNGITYVNGEDGNPLEVNIDKNNVDEVDTYEIKEINTNDEYYKINGSLTVNVTKKKIIEGNNITYKLNTVYFEDGTIDDNGVAKKIVKLENDETAEVTAEIVNNTVRITVPNEKKKGTYSLKIIKYKKGTTTAVAGAKFNLIGGNIGSLQLEKGGKPLSEENYSEIVTSTEPVAIWNDVINIRDIATPDTFTLKEADVGENNTDMFVGFTEPIKITINKNNNYNVESIGLAVGDKEATEQNGKLVFNKSIHNQKVKAMLSFDKSTNTLILEVENPEKYGSFDFNLVKYIKGTTTPLDGAGFKIKIVNKETNEFVRDGEGNAIDGTKEIFVENGKILIENINIAKVGITYEVTIEETTVPEGYLGLDGPITFTAVSEANTDGETYSLKPSEPTTIANAKLVEVKEDEILVEAENRVEPTIHKGVKDVENQSSGYYNEITGDTYESEEDAKKVLHDWVINTSLPNGVEDYSIYEISDKIDDRLTYEGIASVKIIEEKNTVADLVEGTDYKVAYDEASRMLKITFIGQDQAISETVKNNIGKTIEVRFNTKFALDDNGNIIALNQSVPNQATLTYGNGSTVKSETPEVHTGGVGLFKYDKKTGKALSGAHFKIATSKENAENKVFLKDTEGNDVEAISGEDGVAEFTGLEFGEDALNKVEYKVNDEITGAEVYKYDWEKVQTTYYIVETESPEGYMLLEEPIEAIVKKDNYNIEDITSLIQVGNQSNKFDLKLRKWVTQAIVIENGKTVYTETGHKAEDEPEEVVKVDLRKSKLEDVVVKFKYSIRVTNEGEIAGEATEIRDDKPDGLIFVQDDNPDWRYENGDIITDKLAGTTLQPGESAEVEILLTWDNSEDNMGTMINRAEIQKDHNDYGVPDIDSTPGNRVPGEDDIDDAPVMITVKTGTDYIIYSSILLGAIAIITAGGVLIKKKVMKRI